MLHSVYRIKQYYIIRIKIHRRYKIMFLKIFSKSLLYFFNKPNLICITNMSIAFSSSSKQNVNPNLCFTKYDKEKIKIIGKIKREKYKL